MCSQIKWFIYRFNQLLYYIVDISATYNNLHWENDCYTRYT